MTPQERTALGVALRAETNPAIVDAVQIRNDTEVARLLNLPSTFVVWKRSVSQDEIMQNGFNWTQVDNLTAGKARIWEWLFQNPMRSINPSKANVRAGIVECWSGTSERNAVQAVVLGHCKRVAAVAERYFATGTGTDATPGNLVFEGTVSIDDIGAALNG